MNTKNTKNIAMMCQYQLNYRHAGKTIYHEEAQTFEDVIKVFLKAP